VCVRHDPLIGAPWLTYMCDITHSYVWHDSCRGSCQVTSLLPATRLVQLCDVTRSYVRHDSSICVPWLIRMCHAIHMTHSSVWRDAFICATWLIHMCTMTCSYVRHDSFICIPWHPWHDSFTCATWWHIQMCHMTHSDVSHFSFKRQSSLNLTDFLVFFMFLSVWPDSFIRATRLFHKCTVSEFPVTFISLSLSLSLCHFSAFVFPSFQLNISFTWLFKCVRRLTRMCDMPH